VKKMADQGNVETMETKSTEVATIQRAGKEAGEPETTGRCRGGRQSDEGRRSWLSERRGGEVKIRSTKAGQHGPAMVDEKRRGGGRSRPREAPGVLRKSLGARRRRQDTRWEGDLAGPRMLGLSDFRDYD